MGGAASPCVSSSTAPGTTFGRGTIVFKLLCQGLQARDADDVRWIKVVLGEQNPTPACLRDWGA